MQADKTKADKTKADKTKADKTKADKTKADKWSVASKTAQKDQKYAKKDYAVEGGSAKKMPSSSILQVLAKAALSIQG